MRRPIEEYALLSDLQTAALVHRQGSIDWCCFPRFDSDASFAALLGHGEHGRWLLAPETPGDSRRRYRNGSLVLETEWETSEGRIRVIDFMPPRGEAPHIVQLVEGLAGRVTVRSELAVRFGYGRIVPSLRRLNGAHVATAGDPEEIQIVYGVAGERRLPEWTPEWLPGFEDSRPVRVGNAASEQEQLDVYGEVMDALCQARRRNVGASLGTWAPSRGRQIGSARSSDLLLRPGRVFNVDG